MHAADREVSVLEWSLLAGQHALLRSVSFDLRYPLRLFTLEQLTTIVTALSTYPSIPPSRTVTLNLVHPVGWVGGGYGIAPVIRPRRTIGFTRGGRL